MDVDYAMLDKAVRQRLRTRIHVTALCDVIGTETKIICGNPEREVHLDTVTLSAKISP